MQQFLTAFGLDWHLLVIQMINFGLLLAGLTYFLYTPVMKMLDERRAKIAEGMRVYEASEQTIKDAATKSDEMIGAAGREAEQLVAEARTRASEKEAELVRSADAKAEATLIDARARADEEYRKTLSASEKDIARAAMLAAEKILRTKQS